MNEGLLQGIFLLVNCIGTLAFWSLRQEVRYVKQLLTVQQVDLERRISVLEMKMDSLH